MDGTIAVTSQSARELDDLMTGVRNRKKHRHHSIPDLTNAVIDGIQTIVNLRTEIKKKK